MVWCGVVWCGVVWCGVVCCSVVFCYDCIVWKELVVVVFLPPSFPHLLTSTFSAFYPFLPPPPSIHNHHHYTSYCKYQLTLSGRTWTSRDKALECWHWHTSTSDTCHTNRCHPIMCQIIHFHLYVQIIYVHSYIRVIHIH